jgi:hypothetical protein
MKLTVLNRLDRFLHSRLTLTLTERAGIRNVGNKPEDMISFGSRILESRSRLGG